MTTVTTNTPPRTTQNQSPLPAGWVPMPSIASQVETDPAKKLGLDSNNLIRANQSIAVQAPPISSSATRKYLPMPQKIAEAVKVPLPNIPQKDDYSCGPMVLKAVIDGHGDSVGKKELMEVADTNPQEGTAPSKMVEAAKKYGLMAEEKHNMTTEDLKKHLDAKRPVIILVQAWGDKEDYSNTWDSGHYIVAIGYDSNHVIFEDPMLEDEYGAISFDELDDRWHDKRPSGQRYDHYGIVLWKERKEDKEASLRARKALAYVG